MPSSNSRTWARNMPLDTPRNNNNYSSQSSFNGRQRNPSPPPTGIEEKRSTPARLIENLHHFPGKDGLLINQTARPKLVKVHCHKLRHITGEELIYSGEITSEEEELVSYHANGGWRGLLAELGRKLNDEDICVVGPRYPSGKTLFNRGQGEDSQFLISGKAKKGECSKMSAIRALAEEIGVVPQDLNFSYVQRIGKAVERACNFYYEVSLDDLVYSNIPWNIAEAGDCQDMLLTCAEEYNISVVCVNIIFPEPFHLNKRTSKGIKTKVIKGVQTKTKLEPGDDPFAVAVASLYSEHGLRPRINRENPNPFKPSGFTVEEHAATNLIVNMEYCEPLTPDTLQSLQDKLQAVSVELSEGDEGDQVENEKINVLLCGTLDSCKRVLTQVQCLYDDNVHNACGVTIHKFSDIMDTLRESA